MRFKSPEFVVPRLRMLELVLFANKKVLGRLFSATPDADTGALSQREFDRLHERVAADLAAIVNELPMPEPKRLIEKYQQYSSHGAKYNFETREFSVRFEFPTLESQTSFLTLLLHANAGNGEFPGDISRCKHCRIFFFATLSKSEGARGPKPRTYCSADCRHAASISTPRVNRHRRNVNHLT